ncbi:MAG: PilZ domain-containing protein [Bdellovibrionota bacterium]
MKRRPWPIVLLAFFHIFSPVGNFFFNAQYVNANRLAYFKAHFIQENLVGSLFFFLLPPIAGLTIYACKKWSFWVYLGIMSVILVHSVINWGSRPEVGSIVPLLILFTVNIVLVAYLLIPAVRTIYFDPRLRWWETKPRYSVDYDAEVKFNETVAHAKVVNLSESGLFAQMKDFMPDDGSRIEVSFKDDGTLYIAVGTAIHHQRQGEMGIGVQFVHTSDSTRSLKFLIRKLNIEGKRIQWREPGPEDSLLSWFSEVIKSPKGLVPKVNKKNNT